MCFPDCLTRASMFLCNARRLLGVGLVFGLLAGANAEHPRSIYPSREVQIVVPQEPGGGIDLIARLMAKSLAPVLAQPVVVLNRSGASGNIGTVGVARAQPDGYTLLMTGVGHLVSPLLHARAGYEPLKDFAPIARIATAPNVLVVHQSLKGMSLAQLLLDPRSRSGGWAFASSGYGHSSHLAAEVMMSRTGARWIHVPYRGTGPATKALVSGEVHMMFVPSGSVQTVLGIGTTYAVAVAHPHRLESLPGTPTLGELGIRNAEFFQWYGVFAPTGTSETVVSTLQSAIASVLNDASMSRQLRTMGLEPDSMGKVEFSGFLAAETQRLETLVRKEQVEGPEPK